jgi:deazaflavin-dependent oxidoreductase (nitroreductase family)
MIAEFRANGGEIGGMLAGVRVLLLHSVGAKSGAARVNPLRYRLVDGDGDGDGDGGDRWAIFGSGGGPSHPAWYYNLLGNPQVTIEVGTETIDATARVADREERDPIWAAQKEDAPLYEEFELAAGTRTIPVVILARR